MLAVEDVSLAEAKKLQYKAISYTWGTAEPTKKVWVDGSHMLLRPNIWRFLEHKFTTAYNLRDRPRYWIDAICIDQNNASEKALQVAMMGHIFRTAQAVYIWLDETSTQKALVSAFKDRCFSWRQHGLDWGKPEWELVACDYFAHEYRTGDQLKQELFEEIRSIASHDYWQRLWTLQEVLLGQHVYIVLSDTIVGLEAFHHFRKVAIAHSYGSFPQPEEYAMTPQWSSLNHMLNFLGFSRQYQYSPNERNWPLDNLLSISGTRKCSVIHDKIYGLIGLCAALRGFNVDYECSVQDLLVRTLERIKEEALRPGRANPHTTAKIGLDNLCYTLDVKASALVEIANLVELMVQTPNTEDEDGALAGYGYIFMLDQRRFVDSGSRKLSV